MSSAKDTKDSKNTKDLKDLKNSAMEEAAKATKKGLDFLAKKTAMSVTIEIIVGLAIAFFVYWISLIIIKSDNLVMSSKIDKNIKAVTNIISGQAESSQVAQQSFNTVNSFTPNFVAINPSVNIKGGSQFSYSLWIYVGTPSAAVNQPIFLRGDDNKFYYTVKDNVSSNTISVHDYVSFCPLLEFGNLPMEFNIRFNTNNNLNETIAITNITTNNDIFRSNLLSMMTGQWFMMTIVFEDNLPLNDFENGLSVKFYINDSLYKSSMYPNTMIKQNQGNIFLFPNGSISQCKISNFRYYNYALGQQEITANAKTGVSTVPMLSLSTSLLQPLVLTDYNMMDIYNT